MDECVLNCFFVSHSRNVNSNNRNGMKPIYCMLLFAPKKYWAIGINVTVLINMKSSERLNIPIIKEINEIRKDVYQSNSIQNSSFLYPTLKYPKF